MKIKILFCVTALFLVGGTPLVGRSASARDVTRLVIEQTDFDEQIADACNIYCQGNKRKGSLRQVIITPVKDGLYRVKVFVDFKNHQQMETTHGPFDLFNYTLTVIGWGVMEAGNCHLKIEDLKTVNDLLGFDELVKKEKGEIYEIPDCGVFL